MFVREIHVSQITQAVRDAVIKANIYLPESLCDTIRTAETKENNPLAKSIFCDMCKNLDAAHELQIPVCQDTGMAVIFCEIGQEVHIVGGDFEAAVNEGVRQG
ncbi:MAG: fumarate hydratase, partial [Clostridia bacterium]|nr:fumarate hydratase [Clostridia bacterium]